MLYICGMKRKKDYKESKKSRLKVGAIVPIYSNWKLEEGLLGYAKLNFKVSKKREELSFERASVGRGSNSGMVVYKYERWNITFVEPRLYQQDIDEKLRRDLLHRIGFITNWNIAYFVTTSSNYKS